MEISLKLNGKSIRDDVAPRVLLVDYLREHRDLTAAHIGCEIGVCGACTVLIDGEPARSCLIFAVVCDGRDISTIEGLAADPIISALREAFHEYHGLQCGYCTPAMLITARDLISRNRAGTERQIRDGLAGALCRCTGYTNIVKSISHAAAKMANKLANERTAGVAPRTRTS